MPEYEARPSDHEYGSPNWFADQGLSRREQRKIRRQVWRDYRTHKREHGEDCSFDECCEGCLQQLKGRYSEGVYGIDLPWDLLLSFFEQLIERMCPPENPTGVSP